MNTVVANASPLIALAAISRLDLLKALFGEVSIPQQVFAEVVVSGAGRPGQQAVSDAIRNDWLRVKIVESSDLLTTLQVDLNDGEAAAIVLALENAPSLLLLDERKARARAKALDLNILGTVGVLLLAHENGLEPDLQPLVDQLIENGFRLSPAVYGRILGSG